MGVIFRQSFKSSVYSYIGVLIGFITVGYLMPRYLTQDEIGLRMQIQSYALLISSIIAFGIPQTIVRMFPHFVNAELKNHGILTLLALISFTSTLIFAIGFHFLGAYFLKSDIENSLLFAQHYKLILPFTIATLFFITIDGYATATRESTIGTFLKDIVLRIGILLALITFAFFEGFSFNEFINTYTLLQFAPILILILFLSKKNLFPISRTFSFPSKKLKTEFISVSFYSWVNIISSVAVISIDSIMLSKIGGSADVGIYTTVNFFASLMLIPKRGLGKITNAIIADHFKNGNTSAIESIYEKSTTNFLIMGLFLFGNLIFIIPFIFKVVIKGYDAGLSVLIFIGLVNLIKMATGVKFILISNSKYYRWNTILLSTFMFSLVITNLIFIPRFGITGAAIASLISSAIHHLVGVFFVKTKLKFWPFSPQYFQAILLFLVVGVILHFIKFPVEPVISGFIKSFLYSSIMVFMVWKLKLSPDLNEKLRELLILLKIK